MFLVAANAARILTREEQRDAVGEEKEGTTGEESRGCDDEAGKFRAVLSGKGWFTHAREASKEMEGDYGPTRGTMTCRPAENYDSSFSTRLRVSFSFLRHF